MKKIIAAITFSSYLLFSFFCFTSFNFKSTEIILSGMDITSDFYQKTQSALFFLMILLITTPIYSFMFYILSKKTSKDFLVKFSFFTFIFSSLIAFYAYTQSGVFPFSIPVIE